MCWQMTKYPQFAQVKEQKYKINTDFRVALKCDEIARNNVPEEERALAIIYLLFGDKGLKDSQNWNELLSIALKYLNFNKKAEENEEKEILE